MLDVALAIIVRDGLVLIGRRPAASRFGGLWEFPGGKAEPGESMEQCLRREIAEELGVSLETLRPLPPIRHDYPHGPVTLHPHLCTIAATAQPQPLANDELRWVAPSELPSYRFPDANVDLLARVTALLSH